MSLKGIIFGTTLIISGVFGEQGTLNAKSFPPDFLFGTSTSSYQIEGAWNINGKSESIWDRYAHKHPELILDGSNGDIACDSYHKYKEDVALLKDLGVQFYRFSIAWSRILPNGLSYKINSDGVRYYNDLINTLLENNITPMVTMFHGDLPQTLQDLGGFANELIVDWFEDYANVLFEQFGDRVKLWITINEPIMTCLFGYGETGKAPGLNSSGVGDYLCAHYTIKAHARVYHLYQGKFKNSQQGKVGISIPTFWFEPTSPSKPDGNAAQRTMEFVFAWYADPIFHPNGNYPQSMRDRIQKRSKKEGFIRSRLPEFSEKEIEYIKGTYDYFGLNHYSTSMAANSEEAAISQRSFLNDARIKIFYDPEWPSSASPWLKVVPWGFRKVLNYIKNRYGNIEIIITENGFSDHGELDDQGRIDYYEQYLSALLDAIHEDRVNVKGYSAWSLIDNFEWNDGYQHRFGLHHVDFNDPERPRTKKSSAKYYKQVIAERRLPKRRRAVQEEL